MSAQKEYTPEEGYQTSYENLSSMTHFGGWQRFLQGAYLDLTFCYGESGMGLVLPHDLVWISSESRGDIARVEGNLRIDISANGRSLVNKTHGLKGKLPDETILDVVTFSEQIKVGWEDFHKELLDPLV